MEHKLIIINGHTVIMYRVRGFVFPSWCSDETEAERITERRVKEWTAIKSSGSRDVKSTLAELEVTD